MGSAILSGRVDYVRITDPVTMRKAQSIPGSSTANYNQSVIHATWVNTKKKPFDDLRVRRAMHLALDRSVLAEVVKDVAPMSPGSFIYPFSEFATPKEGLAKRLGYQPDRRPQSRKPALCWPQPVFPTASTAWIIWSATSRSLNRTLTTS